MGHFEQVEDAWRLSDAAREYAAKAGRDVSLAEYLEQVFAASPLLDRARTQAEGGAGPQRIFLQSPYGLQWREQHKDWIPFRHGDIDLNNV
jgi:hypothetical protein